MTREVLAAPGSAAEAAILRKAGICPECRCALPKVAQLARCWPCHHEHVEKFERVCRDARCPEHGKEN